MKRSCTRPLTAACLLTLAGVACTSPGERISEFPSGGEFRVLAISEPESLNPAVAQDVAARVPGQNLFNKLVCVDADDRVIKDLADSWEVLDRGATYTFHLARGVRWHDGKRFTSADVKWTLEALKGRRGPFLSTLNRIASIDTPDEETVTLRLQGPWMPFLPNLAFAQTYIYPKHIFAGTDLNATSRDQKPVGTGPFRFVSWKRGSRMILERNPDYFRFRPSLDRLIVVFSHNASEDAARLFTGKQIDFTIARPRTSVVRELSKQPGVMVMTRPHPARYYLAFNLRQKPWNDPRVRRAIATAVDRDALTETALLGYGSPGIGFYTPAISWAYHAAARAPSYDLPAAIRALAAAGAGRGSGKYRLVVSSISPLAEIAAELQVQLQRAGAAIDLVALAPPEWHMRVVDRKDFDLAVANGSWGPDPDILELRFGSQGSYQFMGYANAEFDARIVEGARGETIGARAQAYAKAQEILARDLPVVPLLEHVQFEIYREGIVGLPQLEALGLVGTANYGMVRWRK